MKRRQGFTLIELLVVVAIMGLLAALAVVALNNARQRARDARRVADVKQIQTALELYYLDNNEYPNADATSSDIDGKCISGNGAIADPCGGTPTYMAVIPTNPSPKDDGDCGNTSYTYTAVPTGDGDNNISYYIEYCVGSKISDLAAGAHTATPAGLDD